MKKAIAVVIVFITVLIAGCTPAEDPKMQACMQRMTIDSESEYNDYLAKEAENIPSVFVKWEDIQMLGEFSSFGLSNHYYSYWYGIKDKFSNELILYIDHAATDIKAVQKKLTSLSEVKISSDMTSMDRTNCTEKSTISRNGISYYYLSSGLLLNIYWFDENTAYTLSGFGTYPVDAKGTFISRLLSLDDTEFESAFAEIKQALDAN